MDIPCSRGRAEALEAGVDEVFSFREDVEANISPLDVRVALPVLGGERRDPEVG